MSEATQPVVAAFTPDDPIASIATAIELARDPDATDEARVKLRDACAAYLATCEAAHPAPRVPAPIAGPLVAPPLVAPLASAPPSPIAAAITAAIETLRNAPPERRLDIALQHVRQAHALVEARARRPGGVR